MASLTEVHQAYRAAGFSTIPVARETKSPLVKWQTYQNERPSNDEIAQWVRWWPDANVGLVMGDSKHVAIDIDGSLPLAYARLQRLGIEFPPTAPVQQTGKGHHVLFSTEAKIGDRVGWMSCCKDGPHNGHWQIDVRGVGYIIVAPSVHENGTVYRWIRPFVSPAPRAPETFVALLEKRETRGLYAPASGEGDWVADLLLNGSPQGQRNNDAARLAGYLFRNEPYDIAKAVMYLFAGQCTPPMNWTEIDQICASIAPRAAARGRL